MNVETIRRLFDYMRWANAAMWERISALDRAQFTEDVGYSWGSVHKQVTHMMSAEWVWITRLQGESPGDLLDFDRYRAPEGARNAWQEITADTRAYLDGLTDDDLAQTVTYTNTRGTTFENRVVDVLLHMVNHATDHRAQIYGMIAALGGETGPQDYIHYLRKEQD